MEYVRDLVNYAHNLDRLTITAIGTSQEGTDTATIRQIALIKRTEEIQYSLEETF